jgi:hypothetical protein
MHCREHSWQNRSSVSTRDYPQTDVLKLNTSTNYILYTYLHTLYVLGFRLHTSNCKQHSWQKHKQRKGKQRKQLPCNLQAYLIRRLLAHVALLGVSGCALIGHLRSGSPQLHTGRKISSSSFAAAGLVCASVLVLHGDISYVWLPSMLCWYLRFVMLFWQLVYWDSMLCMGCVCGCLWVCDVFWVLLIYVSYMHNGWTLAHLRAFRRSYIVVIKNMLMPVNWIVLHLYEPYWSSMTAAWPRYFKRKIK